GQAGTTVEVSFTGTDLDVPETLLFSHPGIRATALPPEVSKVDPPKKGDPKQPAMQHVVRFKVEIRPDVPVGSHDVRLVAKHGVSNARTFVVGDLPEVAEKEPNNDVDQAQRVELNSTVNGTVAQPTDVDYYVFAGRKGQRVLIHCACASIDSKLTPELKVLDRDHREIASHRAAPLADGLVDLTLPDNGDYTVRLVQFAHQIGGPGRFYPATLTPRPRVDAALPPPGAPGPAA